MKGASLGQLLLLVVMVVVLLVLVLVLVLLPVPMLVLLVLVLLVLLLHCLWYLALQHLSLECQHLRRLCQLGRPCGLLLCWTRPP